MSEEKMDLDKEYDDEDDSNESIEEGTASDKINALITQINANPFEFGPY